MTKTSLRDNLFTNHNEALLKHPFVLILMLTHNINGRDEKFMGFRTRKAAMKRWDALIWRRRADIDAAMLMSRAGESTTLNTGNLFRGI